MTARVLISADWHRELAEAIRDPDELIEALRLDEQWREPARRAARLFPVMVTQSFLSRMTPGNPDDPLLRQVLPLDQEFDGAPGFTTDAVGDQAAQVVPGLLQKYAGRCLLIATGACAVHCRYCFRRHYPYGESPRTLEAWEPALAAIRADESLQEVILSGGDPLMLTDRRLGDLIDRLADIPQLTRLRIHSRLPIVLPSRITESLLGVVTSSRLTPIMVVHANHAQELQGDCGAALKRLITAGIPTLNQAVLLRGVNDQVAALRELCEQLVNLGVFPYYLHQLDRVRGASHFEVPAATGRSLIAELRRLLPGYAVPRYVQEVSGEPHKLPIG